MEVPVYSIKGKASKKSAKLPDAFNDPDIVISKGPVSPFKASIGLIFSALLAGINPTKRLNPSIKANENINCTKLTVGLINGKSDPLNFTSRI